MVGRVTSWRNLRAALVAYDLGEHDREAMLDAADTDDDVAAWADFCASAIEKVKDAFFADCVAQGVPNSRDHCRAAASSWLRELADSGAVAASESRR